MPPHNDELSSVSARHEAEIASLVQSQREMNQAISGLAKVIHDGFERVHDRITHDRTETDAKIADTRTLKWPAVSAMVALAGLVGAMWHAPIWAKTDAHAARIADLYVAREAAIADRISLEHRISHLEAKP